MFKWFLVHNVQVCKCENVQMEIWKSHSSLIRQSAIRQSAIHRLLEQKL